MSGADVLGLIGVVVGVLGIAAAVWAAWWFGRGPRIVTQVTGTTLLSAPDNNHIEVLYDGRRVNMVTQSIIWVWREGRGTVRGTDVVAGDPITIKVPKGAEILDAALLMQSADANNVRIEADPSGAASVTVAFDYLDQRQGAVIEVMHTAPKSIDITVTGTIMGIPKGIKPVRSGVSVALPMGVAGIVDVTIPTRSIPRSLRLSVKEDTDESMDAFFERVARSLMETVIRLRPL